MSEEDLQLLITLDDPGNAQECDTYYNQGAESWKGTLGTVTAPTLKNWPTDFGRRGAAHEQKQAPRPVQPSNI